MTTWTTQSLYVIGLPDIHGQWIALIQLLVELQRSAMLWIKYGVSNINGFTNSQHSNRITDSLKYPTVWCKGDEKGEESNYLFEIHNPSNIYFLISHFSMHSHPTRPLSPPRRHLRLTRHLGRDQRTDSALPQPATLPRQVWAKGWMGRHRKWRDCRLIWRW